MKVTEDWASKLVDRLPNSPAAELMLLTDSPLQVDGRPHKVGRRMAEVCALFGRKMKAGRDFAAFVPAPDAFDVVTVAVYLYWVRLSMLFGVSAPGHWARPSLLQSRQDIWLLTHVTRLRFIWLDRLTMQGRPITEKIACGWRAGRGSATPLVRTGDIKLPMVGLFGLDAVMQGSLAAITEQHAAPLVVVVDALGLNESYELDRMLERLRRSSQGAPILMLGSIGDQPAVVAARDAQIPVWMLRAGDVARLDQVETEHSAALGTMAQKRSGGADLASLRLTNKIRVDLGVLSSPAAQRLFTPFLRALELLERSAADHAELLSRARAFARAVLSLAVPWKIHADTVANSKRVGRFSTPSLETRLHALRASVTETGQVSTALARVVELAELIFEVISSPNCVTAKQAALLKAAVTAQSNRQPLHIICANETAQRAVQMYLAEYQVDVVNGCVQVVTRTQVRRAVAGGTNEGPELLLLDPLGFSDGFYFSGITPCVRLLIYALERPAAERQLKFIGRDTQCTSALGGDKRSCVVADDRLLSDKDIEDLPPLWELQPRDIEVLGVWPGKLPSVEPFTFLSSEWMQEALQVDAEEEAHDSTSPNARESASSGPRISIQLQEETKPILLLPEDSVVLLDQVQDMETGNITASDVQVGMKVMIAQRNNTGDVLDRILDRCELSAELEVARQLRRMWQDGIAQLAERTEGSGPNALAQLVSYGVLVTRSQTVRHWMRGMVLGPRDLESVSAVGHATQRAELTHNSRLIFKALAQMRRLYIAVTGKALQYAKAGAVFGPDEIIDPALQLRRSDLQNFCRIGHVTQVETVVSRGA